MVFHAAVGSTAQAMGHGPPALYTELGPGVLGFGSALQVAIY
jgi:hypothetical protein